MSNRNDELRSFYFISLYVVLNKSISETIQHVCIRLRFLQTRDLTASAIALSWLSIALISEHRQCTALIQ